MSDEQTNPPPAPPVRFYHYCDYPGCVKWGPSAKSVATASPNGATPSTWLLTIGMGDPTRETERSGPKGTN